jgi:hypothetical protein
MIPNWQIVVLTALALIALAGGIYVSPNSYAHAFLWGTESMSPGRPGFWHARSSLKVKPPQTTPAEC